MRSITNETSTARESTTNASNFRYMIIMSLYSVGLHTLITILHNLRTDSDRIRNCEDNNRYAM